YTFDYVQFTVSIQIACGHAIPKTGRIFQPVRAGGLVDFFFIILLPPIPTLFPYTTLFRSFISKRRISGMALFILALLQRIFLMSSLMLLLVWLIFFMVLIKLLPILGTISGKTVKLMVLALICLGNNRQDRRVGKECKIL